MNEGFLLMNAVLGGLCLGFLIGIYNQMLNVKTYLEVSELTYTKAVMTLNRIERLLQDRACWYENGDPREPIGSAYMDEAEEVIQTRGFAKDVTRVNSSLGIQGVTK